MAALRCATRSTIRSGQARLGSLHLLIHLPAIKRLAAPAAPYRRCSAPPAIARAGLPASTWPAEAARSTGGPPREPPDGRQEALASAVTENQDLDLSGRLFQSVRRSQASPFKPAISGRQARAALPRPLCESGFSRHFQNGRPGFT